MGTGPGVGASQAPRVYRRSDREQPGAGKPAAGHAGHREPAGDPHGAAGPDGTWLPAPVRQLWIEAARARLDLAWPQLGLFVELDGQHHKGQPVYDARRETAVVAATGWLCGRFTWAEVVHMPNSTARRLAALADQARRRPVAQLPRSSSATR